MYDKDICKAIPYYGIVGHQSTILLLELIPYEQLIKRDENIEEIRNSVIFIHEDITIFKYVSRSIKQIFTNCNLLLQVKSILDIELFYLLRYICLV